MQHTIQYSLPGQPLPPPPPLPSRPATSQNKVLSQREYREREGESFNMLRDVIRILTGEEPRTRLEVLRKAIDLLLSSRIEGPNEGLASTLSAAHAAPTSTMGLGDMALDQPSHCAQISHWIQTRQSNAGFDMGNPCYDTHFHDNQRYPSMSTVPADCIPNYSGSRGSGEDSFNHQQFNRPF